MTHVNFPTAMPEEITSPDKYVISKANTPYYSRLTPRGLRQSDTTDGSLRQTLRWALSMPFAVLMTLGLGTTMASLIAVEFIPQDKGEVVNADINPVAEDIAVLSIIQPPKRLNDIDVPPPPPKLSNAKAERVIVLPYETKIATLDVNLDELGIKRNIHIALDTDYQPIIRIPPVMPNNAQRSGHCKVRFDVSPNGQPFNIETVFCSDRVFTRNTLKSVGNWKYRPKTKDGLAVTVKGVKNIVRFNLTDARGRIIPE